MKKVTMKRAMVVSIIESLFLRDYAATAAIVRSIAALFPRSTNNKTWNHNLRKLARFLDNAAEGKAEPIASIIGYNGNTKLPFYTFSAISGFGFCPGAGECSKWCFTLKSWRYPGALIRQIQNTVLLSFPAGRELIAAELAKINYPGAVFRLYVDGDHDSLETLEFWMAQLHLNPLIECYGYSKSFDQLLAYDASSKEWPANYIINISSGHNHTAEKQALVAALPIVRGNFMAVGHKGKLAYGTKAYQNAAKKAYAAEYGENKKPFVCGGLCGECTIKKHACGSDRFKDIDIIILAH